MNTGRRIKMPWRIAHRGYHAHCVENTLEAFAAAYGLGCDMVEFDVQLSRDGVPVIFHDDDLRRLAKRPERVFELEARDLSTIPLRDPKTLAVGRIPTLEEFLRQFPAKPFYLEIKVPDKKSDVPEYWKFLTQKSVQALATAHLDSFVASFHLDAVRHAVGALNFPRSALIHESLETLRRAVNAKTPDPLAKRLFDSVSFSIFKQAEKSNLGLRPETVLLWHVEGQTQFEAARKAGVAGIVADDVPLMLAESQNKA